MTKKQLINKYWHLGIATRQEIKSILYDLEKHGEDRANKTFNRLLKIWELRLNARTKKDIHKVDVAVKQFVVKNPQLITKQLEGKTAKEKNDFYFRNVDTYKALGLGEFFHEIILSHE